MNNNLTNTQVLLNAYVKGEYKDNPQYDCEDDFFVFFAISQVLKEYDLSDEEIENGLCDASLDGGCDGVYLFIDNSLLDENTSDFECFKKVMKLELCIFQVKNTTSFSEDVLMKWKTTCSNLLNMEQNFDMLQIRYNEKILSSFDFFRKVCIALVRKSPKISIRFYYVSKGTQIHPNVQSQADELCEEIKRPDFRS